MKILGTSILCLILNIHASDNLLELIRKSDLNSVSELIKKSGVQIITEQHVAEARLTRCHAEKKCYRSCSCFSVAILALISSTYFDGDSYSASFINRGSWGVSGFFANKLFSSQIQKYWHAQQILNVIEKHSSAK